MTEGRSDIDLDETIKVLVTLGVDELLARDQLEAAPEDERVQETAALVAESEAGVLLASGEELEATLFELVDALRQAGVAVALHQTASSPAIVIGEADRHVYEVQIEPGAEARALVHALATVLPDTHQLLFAPDYEEAGGLPVVVLELGTHAWLRASAGGAALDAALVPVNGKHEPPPGVRLVDITADRLLQPDFNQRFRARLPEQGSSAAVDAVWARVKGYDARIAWPDGQRRPPGDDLFELTSALAGDPLARALGNGGPLDTRDDKALANVLYRFALVTTLGASWDVLAARQNPGMSAQGVLGFGQLTWSWFIFTALGCVPEADRTGRLLDGDWVRAQERANLAVRQRAWFDLAAFVRMGKRGLALGKLRELLPLVQRASWHSPERVAAALAVHTEPRGDQLTHQPLYQVWPAPLYALARRASALDLLPSDNPFLSRVLDTSMIDRNHEQVLWLNAQLARFDAMDESRLPPLLDPLPVIVDVRITEVDARVAHGRTMLAAREEAEHHVIAPHGGRDMKPGEIWLFEVQGSQQKRARARYDDLGEVSFQIALPTGEWLSRAQDRAEPR